jgi:hypothetical protein
MRKLFQSFSKWLKRRNRVEAASATKPAPQPQPVKFAVLPEFEKWEQSDVMALRSFLSTETGRKLVKVCGSIIHTEAMKESAGDSGAPKAYGMNEMLLAQFNLASDKEFAHAAGDTAANPDTAGGAENDAVPAEYRRSF